MPSYIAAIADVVGSRQFDPDGRALLQEDIQAFLLTINEGFSPSIAAQFVITTGDEFQGLLRDASILPDLLWAARMELPEARVRFGVGYGAIHTPLLPQAIGMDGPAFHAARAAILMAKKDGWTGGVFQGFGDDGDRILNGIAHLLERQVTKLTPRQRQLADLLRNGLDQTEVAEQLGVTRQAVSKQVQSLGWRVLSSGEDGLRAALTRFGRHEGQDA
jgi:hypothetical protein